MTDAHTRLARYLDQLPAGYPPSGDGLEVRLLQRLFTQEEADLALHLTLIPEELRVVAYRARQPRDMVAGLLEKMDRKGLISASQAPGQARHYALSQFVVGFWEGQVDRLDRETVALFEQYAPLYFENGPWVKVPQLRTIPVQESIPITSEVMHYERAEEILRTRQAIAVRNCICRQERQLADDGCDKPMEACLSFNGAARSTVESGKGRMLSLEEALELLERARQAGLVLQPANSQDPLFLCTCCGCCCGVLRHIKMHDEPSTLVANPYHAQHDLQSCLHCGACLEVCPMEALNEAEGRIALNQLRCIGCGLCVGACPADALQLVRKPPGKQPVIPRSTLSTYIRMGFSTGRWNPVQLAGLALRSLLDRILAPRNCA